MCCSLARRVAAQVHSVSVLNNNEMLRTVAYSGPETTHNKVAGLCTRASENARAAGPIGSRSFAERDHIVRRGADRSR